MGELVASIAHEVNQPLMAIVTNAETCLRWLGKDQPDLGEARNAAERIVRNGHRAGEVIRSIRALARKAPPEMAELDMNGVVENILELMRAELARHEVSVETDLRDGLETIMGDRVQLQQVIVNLIMNSIEAMGGLNHPRRVLRVNTRLDEDDNVLVAVEDSGMGLDPASIDRIFDPLFTTKREGLGMGLSISRSIVEAHGGGLWASPRRPHGTIFQFTLPATTRKVSIASVS
jgi:C4-dicarboxylate-specific signal transduction histidine kinase